MVKHFGKQDSAIKTKKELINHEKKSCINVIGFGYDCYDGSNIHSNTCCNACSA